MPSADTARLIASLELKDLFSSKLGNAERALGSFDARLGRTESRSFRAGQQIGTGIKRLAAASVGLAVAGGGVFAKALSAASDLNETVSKVGVVFGKNAKQVLAFGRDSASAMGLSENAALAAAATYGNLFVSLGLTSSKAATMSTAMVTLAGDLASFNNASPEDTLLAIQSGLVGETEPLRKYGINLNDATLRQEAMRLGLTKTVKEVLPPAIKAQAAYSLILKQSGTAQGDFARTSGGMANQIRILKANFTDMLATLAAPALPQVAKIFQRINAAVKENQPAIAELGDSIAGLFSDENIQTGTDFLSNAFQTAKETAPIVAASAKATFGLVQGAVGLFKSLPPEIQKLAVGAFAVNKLTGGLVTNIAGGIIDTVGKQFLQRGGTPANPLFVKEVGLPGLPGGPTPGGGPGGLLKTGAKLAGGVGIAIIGIEALGELIKATSTPAQLAFSEQNAIDENRRKRGGGVTPVNNAPNTVVAGGFDSRISDNILRGGFDRRLVAATERTTAAVHTVTKGTALVRASLVDLRKASGATQVGQAVKTALATIFEKGAGGSGGAGNILKELKAQLKNTHDPALQRVLRSAIDRVEHKIVSRKIVEDQLKKADQIWRSNKTNAEKIEALKDVQRRIGNRNAIATERVQAKIDAAKRAQVSATNSVKRTLAAKDFSVAISNVIKVIATVTNRSTSTAQAIQNRYYNVPK